MSKKILITGATDGIGLVTATQLIEQGHHVLLHGRNKEKLENTKEKLTALSKQGNIEVYVADLSVLDEVKALSVEIRKKHETLDVLINNAGVYVVNKKQSVDGFDVRFLVNTISPFLLTKLLLPLMSESSRIINLSSAAQASFDPDELTKVSEDLDDVIYAQSKLALTMWSKYLAYTHKDNGPIIIAVNPGSMLASKMVKEAYGVNGKDIRIGSNILCNLALLDKYSDTSGQYYDNDLGRFADPHPDALDMRKNQYVVETIEAAIGNVFK